MKKKLFNNEFFLIMQSKIKKEIIVVNKKSKERPKSFKVIYGECTESSIKVISENHILICMDNSYSVYDLFYDRTFCLTKYINVNFINDEIMKVNLIDTYKTYLYNYKLGMTITEPLDFLYRFVESGEIFFQAYINLVEDHYMTYIIDEQGKVISDIYDTITEQFYPYDSLNMANLELYILDYHNSIVVERDKKVRQRMIDNISK